MASRCTHCSCTFCKKSGEPHITGCVHYDGFVPDTKGEIMKRYLKVIKYGSEKDILIYESVAEHKGVPRAVLEAYRKENY